MSRIDRSALKKLSPQQRKELKRDLAAAERAPDGKQRPEPRKRGPSLTFLAVYGLIWAVGGAYFDRHLLPQTRIWFGDQVQALSGFGSEQAILGLLEQAGTSSEATDEAMADVQAVYRAQRAGHLGAGQLEKLAEAELVLERSQRAGTAPSRSELEDLLERYAELAAEL